MGNKNVETKKEKKHCRSKEDKERETEKNTPGSVAGRKGVTLLLNNRTQDAYGNYSRYIDQCAIKTLKNSKGKEHDEEKRQGRESG